MTRGLPALLSIVVGGVAALWLRFNAAPDGRGELFPHDLVFYFLPQVEQVGQRLAAGELPMWNPYPCGGLPLLASLQVAVFYPVTWLSAVTSPERFLAVHVLVHLLVGAGGAALWLRALGVAASLAGAFGVVFAFACLIGQSFWPPEVAAIAWWPWLALCVDRVVTRERPGGWWLALVAVAALQLLAGFPQFAFYGLSLVGLLAAVRVVEQLRSEGSAARARRALLHVMLAVGLGAGVAAVQLAPSLALLGASDRTERFTESEVHYLNPLGQPRLRALAANAVSPAPRLTTYELGRGAGYLGTGTLVLAFVALTVRRRDPLVWVLALAGAAAWVLSDGYLGVGSGVYRALAELPGVAWFRAPERLLFPAFACFVALGALGAGAVSEAVTASRGGRRGLALATAAAGGAVAGLGFGLASDSGAWGAAWRAGVVLAWVSVGLFGLAAHAGGWARWVGVWRALGAVLLVADVAAATGAYGSLRGLPVAAAETVRVGQRAMLDAEALAEVRERAGLSRVEFVSTPVARRIRPLMGVGPAGGLYRLACYETLLPGQWPALSERVRDVEKRGGERLESALMSNVDPERLPALYDAASVALVVAARIQAPSGGRAERIRVEVSENTDALPRAYLLDRFEVAAQDAALDRLVRGDLDPRRTVLLDARPAAPLAGRIERAIPAEVTRHAPERVEVSFDAPSAALLVLTDTDAPGWRAAIDGVDTEILRANGLFRAVVVPAGAHRAVFTYAPPGLRLGASVSVASLLAALLCGWGWRRPGRRRTSAA